MGFEKSSDIPFPTESEQLKIYLKKKYGKVTDETKFDAKDIVFAWHEAKKHCLDKETVRRVIMEMCEGSISGVKTKIYADELLERLGLEK